MKAFCSDTGVQEWVADSNSVMVELCVCAPAISGQLTAPIMEEILNTDLHEDVDD